MAALLIVTAAGKLDPRNAARLPRRVSPKSSHHTVAGPSPMRRGQIVAVPGGTTKRERRTRHPFVSLVDLPP